VGDGIALGIPVRIAEGVVVDGLAVGTSVGIAEDVVVNSSWDRRRSCG